MQTTMRVLSLGAGLAILLAAECRPIDPPLIWRTVANTGQLMPDSDKTFNSFGQPSVNRDALVVFRGRSQGAQEPLRGVYARDMFTSAPVLAIATVADEVPQPNNTLFNGALASFNEFPAFPRIDATSATIATRGQSQPVWTWLLPDGTETRAGTAGVYTNPDGDLVTGASLLGAVADATTGDLVFPEFQVPGATPGTRFDQFPGAAAVSDRDIIAFKGNFTDGEPSTGVFYRDVRASQGRAPVQLIARAGDLVPGAGGVAFGSTAPPSAAAGHAVFVGSDVEEAPTAGGIYRAAFVPAGLPPALLEELVAIGDPVPDELPGPESVFRRFGEGLSLSTNGRHVAFWGTWGSEVRTVTLLCPEDGNADLIAYCLEQYPDGYEVEIPVHQGIFVYDVRLHWLTRIARTGQDGIEDFLYWTFSGRPPGAGGGDDAAEETARWRSSAFAAVSGLGLDYRTAFKARRDGVDGIYLRRYPAAGVFQPLRTIAEVGMPGTDLDPEAPAGSLISGVGLERDGYRDGWLAINAAMLLEGETEAETVGWAGIYLTRLPGS